MDNCNFIYDVKTYKAFESPGRLPDSDIRTVETNKILEKYHSGNILLDKTTRTGVTTSFVSESLRRHEKFLFIAPTNKIIDETVIQDAVKYSGREFPNIIHIPANHKCKFNQELIEEYPDLKELPVLPLAKDCEKCCELECPNSRILKDENIDVIALTYDKLEALQLRAIIDPESRATKILSIIKRLFNIFWDCQNLPLIPLAIDCNQFKTRK